jgi:hypothetical protein
MNRKAQFGFVEVFAWIALLILVVSGMIYLSASEKDLAISGQGAAQFHFELMNENNARTLISQYTYDYSDYCTDTIICNEYILERKINARELIVLRYPKDTQIGLFQVQDMIKSQMIFGFEHTLPNGFMSSKIPDGAALLALDRYEIRPIGISVDNNYVNRDGNRHPQVYIKTTSLFSLMKDARDTIIYGSPDGTIKFVSKISTENTE